MQQWSTHSGFTITRLISGRSGVFLISKDNAHIMLDTSVQRAWSALKRKLHLLGVSSIDTLVLTHTHYDHAGNAQKIREKYGAKVIVHIDDSDYLRSGKNPPIKGTNVFVRPLVRLFGSLFFNSARYQPCLPDVTINSPTRLPDMDGSVELLPCPGHTAGSISLVIDNEIALVGDALFGVFKGSVFPPFAQNTSILVDSWRILLETNCKIFLPAHGGKINRDLLTKCYGRIIKNKSEVDRQR